jgi:hypothetical protein
MACITVDLRGWGTGTMVKIRQQGFANAPKEAIDHAQETHILGWMQAFVEKGETVDTRNEADRP